MLFRFGCRIAARRRMPLMMRLAGNQNGFGLAEVMVASAIMLVGMSSLIYVATNAFNDIALTRHRVRANSLMDQAIERVRALPFDTVKLGHKTSDLDAHLDEVTKVGTEYRFEGERIPNGSGTPDVSPIVPLESNVNEANFNYRTRTYITHFEDDPLHPVLRVTTLMTWTSALRGGTPRETRSQTILTSPTGCSSTATHPFSAPCQAFSFASAGTTHGSISTTTPDAFFGEPITRASLDLAQASSSIQVEQLSSIRGLGQRSNVTLTSTPSGTVQGIPGQAPSRSDNDPGSAGAVAYQATTIPSTPASVIFKSTGPNADDFNSIRLTTAANDTGRSRSTTAANATNVCQTTAEPSATQTDNQPCGEARSRQAGTLDASMRLADPEVGRTFAARVGTTSSSSVDNVRVFTKRYAPGPSDPGTNCTNPDKTSHGCVRAIAERTLGTVVLGGLPDVALTERPPGWLDFSTSCLDPGATSPCDLVQVTNFAATVTAEAGKRAAAPAVTYSGTVKYFNGAGYSTLSLAPGPSQPLSINGGSPIEVAPVEIGGQPHTLRVTPDLRTGGTSTSTNDTCTETETDCSRQGEAIANSPILGTITWLFCRPDCDAPSWTLTVISDVDLGTTAAEATYEDPPPSE